MPGRLQELLGFNQATPYLGFVEGKHPTAWLQGGSGTGEIASTSMITS